MRRKNVVSAIHLLGAGCQLDSTDMNGETALHSAARDGLLAVVQTMCAYGCNVDVVNKVMSCYLFGIFAVIAIASTVSCNTCLCRHNKIDVVGCRM